MPTTPPALTPVLEFPATGDPAFNAKAFAWGTAERTTVAPEIAALAANAYANAAEGADSAAQAAISATTAATQVTLAATQVTLAATQVTLATTQATNAGTSATQAAASAAIATNAANVQGTSTSSVAVPTANGQSRTFVYAESSRAIAVGMFVLVAVTASPNTNWMLLQVTGWTPGTNTLVGTVITYAGTGTFAAWTLSLSGPQGVVGGGLPTYTYANRASLRSGFPADGDLSLVEGLGLFTFYATSDEPDDDESCFANGTGRWLLSAVDPEYADASQKIALDSLTRNWLFAKTDVSVLSIGPRSVVDFRVVIPGAEVGDSVIATPPYSGFGGSGTDRSVLSHSEYVREPGIVILSLRNSHDLSAASVAPGVWSILVIKE